MLSVRYFSYGKGNCCLKQLTKIPINQLLFEFSIKGGPFGKPYATSSILLKHYYDFRVKLLLINNCLIKM